MIFRYLLDKLAKERQLKEKKLKEDAIEAARDLQDHLVKEREILSSYEKNHDDMLPDETGTSRKKKRKARDR